MHTYAGWVTVLGTLTALIGAYYSVLLYKNLRTDIEELLPTTSRSVQDLNEVTTRLESIDNIVLLIFSKDKIASRRLFFDLAHKLELAPKDVVSSVEYRVDREVQFFKDRRALYVELSDLVKVRDYIQTRISYEYELHNPLNIFRTGSDELTEPKFDFEGLKKKYTGKMAGYDRLPGGLYATPDESIRAIILFMPGKGLEQAMRLKQIADTAIAEINPKSYGNDIEIKYTGNVANVLEESAALVEDLILSTIIVLLLVAAVMLLFFRSVMATAALVGSLFMGTFWTFGVSYFVVGYLNANTAFLASIVIGNGINFGTIFLARYMEERRNRKSNGEAIETATAETAIPTVTAALGAALSYGSLMLTGFRGFNQFGKIGFLGMVLCWLSAYTLLPAYLTVYDRFKKGEWVKPGEPKSYVAPFISWVVEHFSKTVCLVSLAAVVLSFGAFKNYKLGVIETDLSKLRDKRSMENGAGGLYHYIGDIFGRSFSPMVVLPKDRNDSRKIASLLRAEQTRQGPGSEISSVQVLDDFIPKEQSEKVAVLEEIRRLLPQKIVSHLPLEQQQTVAEFLNPEGLHPFSETDLPLLVLNKFTEKDGSVGKIVLVDKQFQPGGADDADALVRFVRIGREITDSVAPATPVAGSLPISFDMFESIVHDGPKATLFAFLAVIILVVILFRSFRTIVLILFALILGVIWFAGIILGFRLKINFLNFIALPITFGIGIDYGVNIFQRYEQEGPGSILKVVRHTGSAVLLCSLTTIIGYSSLLIAGNQAFVSFGRLAVLGELTCVVAAVVALPAFLQFMELRAQKKLKAS